MLNLEHLVDLFLPSLIFFGELTDQQNVFLDGLIQLSLKDREDVSGANETVAVSVVEHES